MDERTVAYYDGHAVELAARYESADMSHLYNLLATYLPRSGAVFEIGGGSGRDAAYLIAQGREVTSLDASAGMVAMALAIHPELRGRLHHAPFPLPDGSPLLDSRHDAVVSIGTLVHVPDHELFGFAHQVGQLLNHGGIAVLSVSSGRCDSQNQRDDAGRLHRARPPEEIRLLFERLGFALIAAHQVPDPLARDLLWHVLVLRYDRGQASRPVDHVEAIVRRDRKDATYKLALLRALCDIARSEHHGTRWRQDGTVEVPLGLIAEKWLTYYWPIVALDAAEGRVVIPQKRGRELNKPIAFRAALLALNSGYPGGSLSSFYRDFRSHSLSVEAAERTDVALNAIARTIVVGPVTFAGGALDLGGPFFAHEGPQSARHRCSTPEGAERSLGKVVVPGAVWSELCLIGHWISESIVLRWAELTAEISEGEIKASRVIDLLMTPVATPRDVDAARSVYLGLPDLRCVWTGSSVARHDMAVDHVIPFSLWSNNDLWNLLPTSNAVNTRKSDKLVSRDVLLRRKDAVVHYWEILRGARAARFELEVGRTLVHETIWEAGNWQNAAFSGLIESVETLALQRGVERWRP